MIDEKVINYIRDARAKNVSDEVIKQALILNGWEEQQVTSALSVSNEIQQAPSLPSPNAPELPVSMNKPVSNTVKLTVKTSWNSIYSRLLAVVLAIILLILANHIIDDLLSGVSGVSGKLIINALIVIPFLLIASGLHFAFHQEPQSRKYLIVAQPYYFVASWQLLKLLFFVSAYVLDKNATYGVYFVLILIVAVLTGIIFYVQKFIKNK